MKTTKNDTTSLDSFWKEKIKDFKRKNPDQVIVNGFHYYIGPENTPTNWKGMNGDLYIVEFFDGRVVETTNLWCQGNIPERYRDALPDNAVFVAPRNAA